MIYIAYTACIHYIYSHDLYHHLYHTFTCTTCIVYECSTTWYMNDTWMICIAYTTCIHYTTSTDALLHDIPHDISMIGIAYTACIHYTYSHDLRMIYIAYTAHGGDQTSNIWISRSDSFPVRSFEWRGLRLHTWKRVWNFGDSRQNVFDMYGDSRENLSENLAVVIVLSLMSSVCGYMHTLHV